MQTLRQGIDALSDHLRACIAQLERGEKAKLAKKIGVRQSRINALMNGESVSLDTIAAMAAHFKIATGLMWQSTESSEGTLPVTGNGVTYAPLQQEGGVDVTPQVEARLQVEFERDVYKAVLVKLKSVTLDSADDIERALSGIESKSTSGAQPAPRRVRRGHHRRTAKP